MKCKNCGNEVLDGAKFCPNCGAKLEEEQYSKVSINEYVRGETNTPTSAQAPINKNADPNYRNSPKFKVALIVVNILGFIGFLFAGAACLCSSLLTFANLTPDQEATCVVFLIIGIVVGILITAIGIIPMGKKYWPDGKAKGFLENLPGVFLGLIIASIVVALVFQGIIFVVY